MGTMIGCPKMSGTTNNAL